MMGRTHWVIGGASWLGGMVAANTGGNLPLNPTVIAGGFVIASIAALLPDIDTKNSLASKMLGPVTGIISWVVRKTFGGHRKITHSLIGAGIMGLAVFGTSQALHIQPWVGAAVMIGWLSHVIVDMITREGCPLLWPFSKVKYGLHFVTTGKRAEKLLIHPLAIGACLLFGTLLAMGL